jgi:hypothetical protein
VCVSSSVEPRTAVAACCCTASNLPPSPTGRGQHVHREAVRSGRLSGLAGLGWVRRPGSTHPKLSVPLTTHRSAAAERSVIHAGRRWPPEGTAGARRWAQRLAGRELGSVNGLPPVRRPGPKGAPRRGAPTAANSKRPGRPGSFARALPAMLEGLSHRHGGSRWGLRKIKYLSEICFHMAPRMTWLTTDCEQLCGTS